MRPTDLDELMARIGERVLEQDALLRRVCALSSASDGVDELFERIVDLCLEQIFLDVEFRHTVGELPDDDYLLETARLIAQCRTVGLTPPVSIDQLDLRSADDRTIGQYEPPPFD